MTQQRETQQAWAVISNTDPTEGRGHPKVIHVCACESTARRQWTVDRERRYREALR